VEQLIESNEKRIKIWRKYGESGENGVAENQSGGGGGWRLAGEVALASLAKIRRQSGGGVAAALAQCESAWRNDGINGVMY